METTDMLAEFERCRPWLEAALEYSDGTYTIDDVRDAIRQKKMLLIAGERSAMVFEVVNYPRARALFGFLCGGDLAEIKASHDKLVELARKLSCNRFYVAGRPGWSRALRDLGFRPTSTVVGKRIAHGKKGPPLENLPGAIMKRIEITDNCWYWRGGRSSGSGYGFVRDQADLSTTLAHRYIYQRFVGDIPTGYVVDHLCFVRNCVNPAHLEAVTLQENSRRIRRNPENRRSHCTRGHALEGENLQIEKDGVRRCRTCRQQSFRRSYKARRQRAEALRKDASHV